jgi:hypothetical protein
MPGYRRNNMSTVPDWVKKAGNMSPEDLLRYYDQVASQRKGRLVGLEWDVWLYFRDEILKRLEATARKVIR